MVTSVVMKDDDLERIYDVLEVTKGRVIRILTSVFPRYFAIITRVREDVRSIGPDGGKVVLPQDPRLRATFPKNALYKKIKASISKIVLMTLIIYIDLRSASRPNLSDLEHSPEGVPVAAIVNFRFAIFSSESPKDL